MIANTKCLWTVVITTLITLLTEHICQCSQTFQSNSPAETDNILHNSLTDNDDLKRDWSKFATWGKRGFNSNFAVWGKRQWQNFHSWGKRNDGVDNEDADTIAQMTPVKRKWSKFATWGKRSDSDSIDSDKRNNWSSFHSWGKRAPDTIQEATDMDNSQLGYLEAADKRKWGQMAVWGKRDYTPDTGAADKRKWSKFATWGKRSDGTDDELDSDIDKRAKWAHLSAWGKRDVDAQVEPTADKRQWQFASWGKRRIRPQSWRPNLGAWGKRRWSALNTWGKRSSEPANPWKEGVAQKIVNLFDTNGDGALDQQEMGVYIQTLASLPSIPERGEKEADDTADVN